MRYLTKIDFLFKGHIYAVISNLIYQRDWGQRWHANLNNAAIWLWCLVFLKCLLIIASSSPCINCIRVLTISCWLFPLPFVFSNSYLYMKGCKGVVCCCQKYSHVYTSDFLIKQAEECEIEEKLKELQDMLDAADFTLSRSFIYLVPYFMSLHFTSTWMWTWLAQLIYNIIQVEGRREYLIRKHVQGNGWN